MGNAPLPLEYQMQGKTVIVTGSNTGLGKETACKLARFGAHVVLACRSPDRGKQALDDIKSLVPNASLDLMLVDLADWDSIKAFTEEIRKKYSHIDVLVNNAGTVKAIYEKSKHNYDDVLTVNYLGTFLITQLLLDVLEKVPTDSDRPRVVMIASNAHTFSGPLQINQLELKEDKVGQELSVSETMINYGLSKLCMLLYFRILNLRLREKKSRVLVYAVDPGWVKTELNRAADGKFYGGLVKAIEDVVAKKPEEGVIPSLYCACSPELGEEVTSGNYYSHINTAANLKDYAKNNKDGEDLWEWSEKVLAPWLS